jgi:AraC-like DNA-binding protein
VSTREQGATLVIDQVLAPGDRPWTRPEADHALGTYVALGRRWSGQAIVPREVRFQHRRSARADLYEAFFGCPIRFDAPLPGLTFDREILDLPLTTAQPEFGAYFAGLVEGAARAVTEGDIESDVREAIGWQLRIEQLSLDHVARRLGTSARTLQRHLGARGLTFHALVEDVRRAVALEMLEGTDLPVDDIGQQLGYSEGSAFRRACRRWTGAPPRTLRRRART